MNLQSVIDKKKEAAEYMVSEITHICKDFEKRDPGSKGEQQACEYMADVLKNECGCERADVESFKENPGSFFGWIYFTITFVLAAVAISFFYPLVSIILIVVGLLIVFMQFGLYKKFIDRFFPEKTGHNVTAVKSCKGEVKRRIFFNGHPDAAWEWPVNYKLGGVGFEGHAVICGIGAVYYLVISIMLVAKNGLEYVSFDASETLGLLRLIGLVFVPFLIGLYWMWNENRIVDGANDNLSGCYMGIAILKALKEEGIEEGKNLKVDYQNAQTDTGTASTIADSFVSEKVDMICAIATPCAASAYNSAMNADIPTVYTAVSDPVVAGLAKEDGSSVGNITGSSDVLPVEEQLKMIREMMPDAKKIGILYTTSEANSCSTIEEYKELADKYDFEIVDTGINTSADIEIAASDLVSKVDCLCNLTDNTVVNALQTVLDKANGAKIPVFGSEIEQVKSGCVASMGIDYYQLGIETGKMAAKILKGEEKASDTPFITASKAELYVNTAAADKIGMTLDADYIKDAAETFDKIEVK